MSGIVAGIGWHMLGAASGAAFYAPIEKVKKWPWEITWAVAGLFSWIVMPLSVSFLLLPRFGAFYQSITAHVLLEVALLGAMWGVGNVSYGLTMRYLGMSLGIGVAMGVTLMAGTLIPPLLHGQAAELFTSRSGLFTIAGCGGRLARRGDRILRRPSERATASQRTQGVQFEAWDPSRWNVRPILVRDVVCD